MTNSTKIVAVVPAAGVGSRMGADRPKQYLTLHGKTVLEHTLTCLSTHPQIDSVIVAISPGDEYFASLSIADANWLVRVDGGKERADSVLNALQVVEDDAWAMVHDAARPCLSHSDIDNLINQAMSGQWAGGILASPVRDTMKRALPSEDAVDVISHTESRDALWHALTPQLFPAKLLRNALENGLAKQLMITDEASAIEAMGHRVKLVAGNPANIKITHPDDMPLASFYLHNIQDSQCE